MSYILNALRKSERERQAIEPDTVTARIITHQPPRHQSATRLIAALIIINLAILIYFLGFNEKSANDKTLPAAATQPVAVTPLETARSEMTPLPRSAARPMEPKAPPIAKIVEARTAAPATAAPDKPAAVKKQPIEPIKPVLASQQPVMQAVEPANDVVKKPVQVPTTASAPLPATVPTPAPMAESAPAPKPLAVQAKSDLPFLDELPAEFGRSLPDLPINVFSYSSTPAERFVMIDMVKYTPGQRIKDQLELKEIRPDSIVVSVDGRTFKIKRP